MVALIGGLAALILGLIGIIGWWTDFLLIIKGSIPLILLLGGALAVYLGVEEIKDKNRAAQEAVQEPFAPESDDVEKYKSEVAELKAKLAAMEKEDSEGQEADQEAGDTDKKED